MKDSDYSTVKGYNNLIRDEKTKAILNTNMTEYEKYKQLKLHKENENKKIYDLENDLSNIKNDIDEIKNLLRVIINGSK
jgi:hypothetical protein